MFKVYIEYKYSVLEINIIKKFGYIIFGTFKKSLKIKMILCLIDRSRMLNITPTETTKVSVLAG